MASGKKKGQKEKQKKEQIRHTVKIGLAVLMLVLGFLLAIFSYRLGAEVFSDQPVSDSRAQMVTYDITIRKGESTMTVGMELQRAGVIESGLAFFVQTKVYDCKIPPGTYTVYSKNSSKEIVKYLNQEYLKQQREAESGK